MKDRTKEIVRTSLVGIGINLGLVTAKAIVGLASNSIAILLDAVNNASDALSSVITILGTKLASRRPDKKHPYGYGRIEYLTSMIIAVIVLAAGGAALRESVGKILSPDETSYNWISLSILVAAIAAKIFCGLFFKSRGKSLRSDSLSASGADALFDAILTGATLVGAISSMIWQIWIIEGILGAVISIFILKAGFEMLFDTLGTIIGKRVDADLAKDLREAILAFPEVRGVFDLSLHHYGPTQAIGSAHIEVPDGMTARELHFLSRRIAAEIYRSFGIILTLGVYASGDSSPELAAIKKDVLALAEQTPEILQIHAFYGDDEKKLCTFDLVVDFKADAKEISRSFVNALQSLHPDYNFDPVLDSDTAD